MAKYTDPNTGVKYSTHTGLKVFTVIAVILLVISIVLNVVLYTQRSDDAKLDAGTDEETFADGEGDDGDGDDDDDEKNSDGALFEGDGEGDKDEEEPDDGHDFPELEEDDEDNVIVTMEGGTCMRTGGFDENGVATGVYYYPSHNWNADTDNPFYGCAYCGCECLGHDVYITKSGGIYEYIYPDSMVICELEAADGSETDINSKMQVSLIFPLGWKGNSVEFDGLSYSMFPDCFEIASLTGEPLQIESVEVRQHVYIDAVYDSRGIMEKQVEYRSESGVIRNCSLGDMSTDLTHIYEPGGNQGSFTVYITMKDGGVYTFKYWVGYTQGLEVQYVD